MSERIYPAQQVEDETRRFFQKVYQWMFLGLIISGLTAYYTAQDGRLVSIFVQNQAVFWALLISELVLVFVLAGFIKRIPAKLGLFMFFLYCFLTGLTLSVIFFIYTTSSIGMVFFITAGMFGTVSAYGYFTKTDLSGLGSVLFMGLIGIIIASVVNIFLKNSTFDFIISIIGVLIFTGLTMYDTQKIKKKNIIGNEGTPEDLKESVLGALQLYLDFVNLFLHLLRLLGKMSGFSIQSLTGGMLWLANLVTGKS